MLSFVVKLIKDQKYFILLGSVVFLCFGCLHLVLSLASSSVTLILHMSSLPASINFLWGLPFFLLHGSSIFNYLCVINPLSLLWT